jgi:hypothetical protein
MKNTQCFKLLLLVLLLSCNNEISTPIEANIIPKPFYQKTSNQIFLLDNKVSLKFSEENKTVANYFNNYIEKNTISNLQMEKKNRLNLRFQVQLKIVKDMN